MEPGYDQIRLFVRGSIFDDVVLSLDVPEIAKSLLELLNVRRHPLGSHQTHVPDPVDLGHPLSLRNERHRESDRRDREKSQ